MGGLQDSIHVMTDMLLLFLTVYCVVHKQRLLFQDDKDDNLLPTLVPGHE